MPYKLKKNAPEFDCVDGPLAGQTFRRGQVYTYVPAGDRDRFELVTEPKKSAPAKPEIKKNAGYEAEEWQPVKAPTKQEKEKGGTVK